MTYLALFPYKYTWMHDLIRKMTPPMIKADFYGEWDISRLPETDFLAAHHLPSEWIGKLQRCKLVQTIGVGYDTIDRPALHAAGIPLAITPEGTAVGVSEHAFLLMLAVSKLLIPLHKRLEQGEFIQFDRRQDAHFLYQKTLGIVGLGRIGKRMAHLARAFEMNVIYNDLIPAPPELERQLDLRRVEFDQILSEADIVTVHTPLTPLTKGFFGAEQFARMKKGAIFINTSRGGTYNTDALYDALKSGHLRGAGLDVFNPEPLPPDHPLLKLENVVCSPHMASGTVESLRMKSQSQLDNFLRVINGEQPINIIPIDQE